MATIEDDEADIAAYDCTPALDSPQALWRKGIMATATLTIGVSTTPIQAQYFCNGARASKRIYRLMIDRSKVTLDKLGRVILTIDPPFNNEANHGDIKAKLSVAFAEVHEYVMTGVFAPLIRTAVATWALALYLEMAVEKDYSAYIYKELQPATALDIMQSAYDFSFGPLMAATQRVIARDFGQFRGRQFHPFVVRVVSEVLENSDLVSGGIYNVCDAIQSYVLRHSAGINVDEFYRLTLPMTLKQEVNPQHATFFVEQIQRYEDAGQISMVGPHRFAALLKRLETMLAKNFFSMRAQDLMLLRPGVFADMILNEHLVVKGIYDISNVVTAFLKERDAKLTTTEFYTVIRVMDDFAICADDVVYMINRIEHHMPKAADLHGGVLRTLVSVLGNCLDVVARFIKDIPIASFSAISLQSLCNVLGRDALQSGDEDLVFDLVASYIAAKGTTITVEQIELTWRTCRFHLLSPGCLARAFQQTTLPKSFLAAALIHKQRKACGEVDERKCEFDAYAKQMLVLRPRLSLEDLKARDEEDKAMQSVMDTQKIDLTRISPILQVGEDGVSLACIDEENGSGKGTALCMHGFDCEQGGIFSFEARIEALPAEFWEILVGVANQGHDVGKWVGASETSWSYLALHSGSRTYFNTVCGQYNTQDILKVGDTIGVLLDCTDRRSGVISFTVNSAEKGVAFEDLYANGKPVGVPGAPGVVEPSSRSHPGSASGSASGSPRGPRTSSKTNVFYPAVSVSRRGTKVKLLRFKWRRH